MTPSELYYSKVDGLRPICVKLMNLAASAKMSWDDLYQEASMALWSCAHRFRTDGGASFSTYADRSVPLACMTAINRFWEGRPNDYVRAVDKTAPVIRGAVEKVAAALPADLPEVLDLVSDIILSEEIVRSQDEQMRRALHVIMMGGTYGEASIAAGFSRELLRRRMNRIRERMCYDA